MALKGLSKQSRKLSNIRKSLQFCAIVISPISAKKYQKLLKLQKAIVSNIFGGNNLKKLCKIQNRLIIAQYFSVN